MIAFTNKITLIIPTHNRHKYLERILNYYDNFCEILIVDSSKAKFQKSYNSNVIYYYLPEKSLNEKISYALSFVTTPYVFLCADDDFILKCAIEKCISFLDNNTDYSCVSGNYLYYKLIDNKVFFSNIYANIDNSIANFDIKDRLVTMFSNYITLYYAIHRTSTLKSTFTIDIKRPVNNLFLNEYLTAIIPLIVGKYKQIDTLYQIREYSAISGDKTTENLNKILDNPKYETELGNFLYHILSFCHEKKSPIHLIDKIFIYKILKNYSEKLTQTSLLDTQPVDKKIGKIIQILPYLGPLLIRAYRNIKLLFESVNIELKYRNESEIFKVKKSIQTYAAK